MLALDNTVLTVVMVGASMAEIYFVCAVFNTTKCNTSVEKTYTSKNISERKIFRKALKDSKKYSWKIVCKCQINGNCIRNSLKEKWKYLAKNALRRETKSCNMCTSIKIYVFV